MTKGSGQKGTEEGMSKASQLQHQIDAFMQRKTTQYPDITHYVDHVGDLNRIK
jgi:hypothetical protein